MNRSEGYAQSPCPRSLHPGMPEGRIAKVRRDGDGPHGVWAYGSQPPRLTSENPGPSTRRKPCLPRFSAFHCLTVHAVPGSPTATVFRRAGWLCPPNAPWLKYSRLCKFYTGLEPACIKNIHLRSGLTFKILFNYSILAILSTFGTRIAILEATASGTPGSK